MTREVRGSFRVLRRKWNRPFLHSAGGFTLIEILVAMSILAISLVVILQLFSGALKSTRVSDSYTRAVFYAQAKMEELLLKEGLPVGGKEGELAGGYRWQAEIVRLDQTEEEAAKLPFDTFQIVVDVSWGEDAGSRRKHVQLSTLKVMEKKEMEAPGAPEGEEGRD